MGKWAMRDRAAGEVGECSGMVYRAGFSTGMRCCLIKYAGVRMPGTKVRADAVLTPAVVAVLEGLLGHGWPSLPVLAGVIVTALALVVIETG